MKHKIIILMAAFVIYGCNQSVPEFANLKLAEQGIAYAPEIDVLMQENNLGIKITLDGSIVYDTSYTLERDNADSIYAGLKKMGVKIFTAETPEWKNKSATFIADKGEEQAVALNEIMEPYDAYFANQYYNLLNAAKSLNQFQDQDNGGLSREMERLDSLGDD